jgi:hypothetical protein
MKAKLKSGDVISCNIYETFIPKALVMCGRNKQDNEKELMFILQDYRNGCGMLDREKYGYRFSWQIGTGSQHDIEYNFVSNITILNRKKMNHEE